VSPVAFEALHQRHQSLAGELAKRGQQVSFLNPVRTGGYSCKSSSAAENLEILQLYVPFKGVSCPVLQMLAARFVMMLLRAGTRLTTAGTMLWISEPSLAWLTRQRWQNVVYDRCDLHGLFPGQNRRAWQKYENRLFAAARLISCSHRYLQQTLPETARHKSVLAGNASADIFFAPGRRQATGARPLRLVSAGAHHEWVDIDWLKMLCSQAAVELHLAGTGRGKSYEELRRHKSVIEHGQLSQARLADLLKSCDIGLVPFRDIELIRGVDPVKVYEYAASGLEVWAPPLAALRENPLIDRFMANTSDLARAVDDLATARTRPTPLVARWSERLQTILDRLDDLRSD
jgi:glycosyltransferase involved in cell wall biosynthesis